MSEKSLQALVDICIEAENWRAYRHEYLQVIEMTKARITRAEAAEKAIDAYIAFTDVCDLDAWHVLSRNVKAYKAACNIVCKLAESSKSD